jgi:hypothetical protein
MVGTFLVSKDCMMRAIDHVLSPCQALELESRRWLIAGHLTSHKSEFCREDRPSDLVILPMSKYFIGHAKESDSDQGSKTIKQRR